MSRKFRPAIATLTKGLLTAAATLTFASVAGLTSASASVHNTATTHSWIETGWNIHLSDQASPSLSSHFFNNPGSFGTGTTSNASPINDGFSTSAVLDYTSYAQFASDLASGAITYPYHWVMYDPEAWAATPLAEQQNPAQYMQMFGALAHANGLQVIMAPARDLAQVPGAACPQQPHQNLDQWYIACNIAGAAAASGDVLVLQDQVNTTNITEFDSLYNTAHAQAQAANPQIQVDPELSTNYGTPGQMAAAAKSVTATGYYINATTSSIRQADQFLQQMKNAGY
jgi:hypothetical protein